MMNAQVFYQLDDHSFLDQLIGTIGEGITFHEWNGGIDDVCQENDDGQVRLLLLGNNDRDPIETVVGLRCSGAKLPIVILNDAFATDSQDNNKSFEYLPVKDTAVLSSAAPQTVAGHIRERVHILQRRRAAADSVRVAEQGLSSQQDAHYTHHAFLDDLLEHAPIGILLISGQGMVHSINRFGLEILGLNDRYLTRSHINDIIPGCDLDGVISAGEPGIAGEPVVREVAIGDDPLSLRYLSVRVVPANSSAGEHEFMALISDVTKEVQAREDACAVGEQKARLTEFLSHELRTPLNAILGFAQLLMNDQDDGDGSLQKKYMENIVEAGNHQLKLINSVLQQARGDDGAFNLKKDSISVLKLVDESLALIGTLAHQCDIQVFKDGVPADLTVVGDHFRVKQCLLNILGNAVKYNRIGGRITISAQVVDDGFVRVRVDDTGIGIAASQLNEVFSRYHRANDAVASKIEGDGIGLALCKHMVELMGGRVGVSSVPGAGSAFWIELPTADRP